jgi:hypothetical protein
MSAADAAAEPLVICDPRPAERAEGGHAAPRLGTLDGVSFALVHNGKTHGMELMHLVLDELRARWRIGDVVEIGPPSPGYGGDPDDAKPAAEAVLAALSAVGD